TSPRVQRVSANDNLERTWSGVVQVDGQASCGALVGAVPCLNSENPAVNETFRAQLCYSPQAPGVTPPPDGGQDPVPGTLPDKSILCVTREFKPIDGVVELSPERGADCATHSDCKANELCFSGACTSSCPANDFPELGGSWQLRVLEPDDQGFFTTGNDG